MVMLSRGPFNAAALYLGRSLRKAWIRDFKEDI